MTCLCCKRSWRNNYSRRGFKVHLSANIQARPQRNHGVGIIYREGRANGDGKILFPNSLDPPLSVFTRHYIDETTRSQVKTLRGYLSWIKNIVSTIHSFWCTVKELYNKKILNKPIDPIVNLSQGITWRYHVNEDFIVSMASNQNAQFKHIFICNLNYKA